MQTCNFDIVDVNPVHDHIAGVLYGGLRSHNVNACSPSVDGLSRVHPELALERDGHVLLEDDPQRRRSCHSVAKRARGGILRVVGAVGDGVEAAALPAFGVPTEPRDARRQRFAVAAPVGVAAPAVVNRVARAAPA